MKKIKEKKHFFTETGRNKTQLMNVWQNLQFSPYPNDVLANF